MRADQYEWDWIAERIQAEHRKYSEGLPNEWHKLAAAKIWAEIRSSLLLKYVPKQIVKEEIEYALSEVWKECTDHHEERRVHTFAELLKTRLKLKEEKQ